jgi:hypothetical protein
VFLNLEIIIQIFMGHNSNEKKFYINNQSSFF